MATYRLGACFLSERPEEVPREHNPDESYGNVDGPDEFRILLAAGETAGQGDRSGYNDQLPAPEVNGG